PGSNLEVVVEQSVLDTPTLAADQAAVPNTAWHGSGNVYCVAGHNWLRLEGKQDFVADLNAWRKKWKSDEKGTIVAEALLDDARMWSLLPESPGYHARSNGKDYGADVTRIGVTAPARPPKK